MALTQLATRIDSRVKKLIEKTCEARGLKIGRFVENALIDKLEELMDIEDIKTIRREPTRPLKDLILTIGHRKEVYRKSYTASVFPLKIAFR
jgi:hypothetical protein